MTMSEQPLAHGHAGVGVKNQVLQKAYLLLAFSFIPCGIGAVVGAKFNPMAMLGGGWVGIIAFFAIFYGLIFAIEKNRYSTAGIVLLQVFTFGMGMMLGPILGMLLGSAAGTQIVVTAAVMTVAVFFAMTIAAHKVKADTNALGRFLLIGAIVLMIGVVANLFFKIPAVSLAISALFVLFSSLMIMWQTKMVIEGGETSYISAALTIFISIYNLFTSLLRLLMAFTGND
jgi:modulator of FtsH protease